MTARRAARGRLRDGAPRLLPAPLTRRVVEDWLTPAEIAGHVVDDDELGALYLAWCRHADAFRTATAGLPERIAHRLWFAIPAAPQWASRPPFPTATGAYLGERPAVEPSPRERPAVEPSPRERPAVEPSPRERPARRAGGGR